MPELDAGVAILLATTLLAVSVFPAQRIAKACGVAAVLAAGLLWLAWHGWRAHERDAQFAQARAIFELHCRSAGMRIHRTVDQVEGVLLMKRRAPALNMANQYALTDPYGDDLGGDGYVFSFLWGRDGEGHVESNAPPPLGYRYVVVPNEDGHGYTRFELGRGPRDQAGVLPVLRTPTQRLPRYGVTWADLSSRRDRDHWIAGSRLTIVDTFTGEVLAERIGWMWDEGMGATDGARHPWMVAALHACPPFPQSGPGLPSRVGQTRTFAEQVLKPRRDLQR